jgi:hypothetical protein
MDNDQAPNGKHAPGRRFNELLGGTMISFVNKSKGRIAEINQKYATPRIKMTRTVKFSLLCLRLYLILLILILIYKFITTL